MFVRARASNSSEWSIMYLRQLRYGCRLRSVTFSACVAAGVAPSKQNDRANRTKGNRGAGETDPLLVNQ